MSSQPAVVDKRIKVSSFVFALNGYTFMNIKTYFVLPQLHLYFYPLLKHAHLKCLKDPGTAISSKCTPLITIQLFIKHNSRHKWRHLFINALKPQFLLIVNRGALWCFQKGVRLDISLCYELLWLKSWL